MRFKMMAFVAAISLASPTLAQTADSAAPAVPAPKPKKERKICRALPGMTGSNMAKVACHTKAEWAIIDERGLDPTGSMSGRSATDAGNMGPGMRPN